MDQLAVKVHRIAAGAARWVAILAAVIHLATGTIGLVTAPQSVRAATRWFVVAGLVFAGWWTVQMARTPVSTGLRWDHAAQWTTGLVAAVLLAAGIAAYLIADPPVVADTER